MNARKALRESSYDRLESLASHLGSEVSNVVAAAASDLEKLLASPVFVEVGRSPEEQVEELVRLARFYKYLDFITLYDTDGFAVGSTDENDLAERELTRWFCKARSGQLRVSAPRKKRGKKDELYLDIYLPIRQERRGVTQVVRASISFQRIWSLLDAVEAETGLTAMLVDAKHDNILASPSRQDILQKFENRLDWRGAKARGLLSSGGELSGELACAGVLFDMSQIGSDTWQLMVFEPASEFLAAEKELQKTWLGTGAASAIAVLLLGFLASRNFTRPLGAAAYSANLVADGSRTVRLAESGPMEMRSLAQAFNSMVDEVRMHEEELERLVAERTRSLAESRNTLRSTTAQLRATNDASREAILVVGADGRVLESNDAFCEIFGENKSRLRGLRAEKFLSQFTSKFAEESEFSDFWARHSGVAAPEAEGEWEVAVPQDRFLSGYTTAVRDGRGNPVARVWMFRDQTKRRALQRGLEQAQKMEAVGRLAGGVAHDFNNLLTGIVGNLSLAADSDSVAADPLNAGHYVDAALKTSSRATQLVGQLLGFSRQSNLAVSACTAEEIITEVTELVGATFDPRIEIKTAFPDEPWTICVDGTQLGQVIMNLCVNARDAMSNGGTLSLTSNQVEVGEAEARQQKAEPGSYVCITVADTGDGIPEELLQVVFEPFFTTKAAGKGTGLGLSTSYGIVRQHKGWMRVASEKGVGTTFQIYLPTSTDAVGEKAFSPISKSVEEVRSASSRIHVIESQRVLLVDDEEVVRKVAEAALKKCGLGVFSVGCGVEAIQIIGEKHREIGAVILDMNMPGLTGTETFAGIREIQKELPVLMCSGYPVDLEAIKQSTGCRPEGFVQKPYPLEELAHQVLEVMKQSA